MSDALLAVGDVIELTEAHRVYAMVPEHFVYGNRQGSFDLCRAEADLSEDRYEYLRGRYIVVRTRMTGGGTGHGPHDIYEDGHCVSCAKENNRDIEVYFFQTGNFTCMIQPGAVTVCGGSSFAGEQREDYDVGPDEVEWVVNDLAELGVRINGRCFFLYKGHSLEYNGLHDDGTPMMVRIVGKREFGETCWPQGLTVNRGRYTRELTYTPGLSDGTPDDGRWVEMPRRKEKS